MERKYTHENCVIVVNVPIEVRVITIGLSYAVQSAAIEPYSYSGSRTCLKT